VTANNFRKIDLRASAQRLMMVSLTVLAGFAVASAQNFFSPGNLVVSRGVYDNNPNNEILPFGFSFVPKQSKPCLMWSIRWQIRGFHDALRRVRFSLATSAPMSSGEKSL
jgi:hypothetical protein